MGVLKLSIADNTVKFRETFFLFHYVHFSCRGRAVSCISTCACDGSYFIQLCSSLLPSSYKSHRRILSYVKMKFHIWAAAVCLVEESREAGRTGALLSVFDSKALDLSIVQSTVTNIGGSRHSLHWAFKMHRELLWPYWLYFTCLGGEPGAPCFLSSVQSCTIVVLL